MYIITCVHIREATHLINVYCKNWSIYIFNIQRVSQRNKNHFRICFISKRKTKWYTNIGWKTLCFQVVAATKQINNAMLKFVWNKMRSKFGVLTQLVIICEFLLHGEFLCQFINTIFYLSRNQVQVAQCMLKIMLSKIS